VGHYANLPAISFLRGVFLIAQSTTARNGTVATSLSRGSVLRLFASCKSVQNCNTSPIRSPGKITRYQVLGSAVLSSHTPFPMDSIRRASQSGNRPFCSLRTQRVPEYALDFLRKGTQKLALHLQPSGSLRTLAQPQYITFCIKKGRPMSSTQITPFDRCRETTTPSVRSRNWKREA